MRIFMEDAIEQYLSTRVSKHVNVGHLLSVVVALGIAYEIGKPW